MATIKYRADKGMALDPRVVAYVKEKPSVAKLVAKHTSFEVALDHADALNKGKKVTVHESVSVYYEEYRGLVSKTETIIIIH